MMDSRKRHDVMEEARNQRQCRKERDARSESVLNKQEGEVFMLGLPVRKTHMVQVLMRADFFISSQPSLLA